MGAPAAKQGDMVKALDLHIVVLPPPATLAPMPFPFKGTLDSGLSTNVNIEGRPAATVGSTATNSPVHIPQSGAFQVPPANRGSILTGSATVSINGKPAARNGDTATTCNDPVDMPAGTVIAQGMVFIG